MPGFSLLGKNGQIYDSCIVKESGRTIELVDMMSICLIQI